jgi:hypothetical protein
MVCKVSSESLQNMAASCRHRMLKKELIEEILVHSDLEEIEW